MILSFGASLRASLSKWKHSFAVAWQPASEVERS